MNDKGISSVFYANLPNEILAMRTECWLLEESRNEAMVLDVKDVLLFQCTFSVSVSNIDFILLLLSHIIVSHFDSFCCMCVLLLFFDKKLVLRLRFTLFFRSVNVEDTALTIEKN